MKYLDNLYRYRKYFAEIIETEEGKISTYKEPFCGRAHVGIAVQAEHKYFSDTHKPIIALWQALLNNWRPPYLIGRKVVTYAWSRPTDFSEKAQGFIGYAYSRDGSFFGDTITYKRFSSAGIQAYKALLRDLRTLNQTTSNSYGFVEADYREVCISANAKEGDVFFLHPPQTKKFVLTNEFADTLYRLQQAKIATYVALNSNIKLPLEMYKKHWKLDTPIVYPILYKV